MSDFQTVCRGRDLVGNEGKPVQVGTTLIAVFRTPDGYYAIDDVCPHMGASLGAGWVENGIVTCPWHAWRFRLKDGIWADNPRMKMLGCYPVRVVNEEVQVQLPAPEAR